jgi:ABC-type transporter Mla MlaB component
MPSLPTVAVSGDGDRLALEGVLDIRTLARAEDALKQWMRRRRGSHAHRTLDLGNLSSLDTPGALFLCGLREKGVDLTGIRAEHKALVDLICALEGKPLPKRERVARWRQLVIRLGKGADDAWHDALDIITFVGRAASATGHALIHPRSLRLPSISRHVSDTAYTRCRSSGCWRS